MAAEDEAAAATSGDGIASGLPPWEKKFDVKKKPPPVPKPRYVIASSPKAAASPSTSGAGGDGQGASSTPTLPPQRPRWGQLDDDNLSRPAPGQQIGSRDGSVEVMQSRDASSGSAASPSAAKLAAASMLTSEKATEEYKASWNRWRSLPSSLEEKLQELVRPSQQPPRPPQPPSKEALEFLESLLSGTEPSTSSRAAAAAPAGTERTVQGSAQVVGAARRLQEQARASRRRCGVASESPRRPAEQDSASSAAPSGSSRPARRRTIDMPCAPAEATADHAEADRAYRALLPDGAEAARTRPQQTCPTTLTATLQAAGEDRGLRGREPANSDEAARSAANSTGHGDRASIRTPDTGSSRPRAQVEREPGAAGTSGYRVSESVYEQRMREKRLEHEKLLREMEEESRREQERLMKEMQKEQAELSANRLAQDRWKEDLRQQTEHRKRQAEQAARERDRLHERADAAWRNRWWKDWQRSQERSQQKNEEHKQWSKEWWEQWKEEDEEESTHEQWKEEQWKEEEHFKKQQQEEELWKKQRQQADRPGERQSRRARMESDAAGSRAPPPGPFRATPLPACPPPPAAAARTQDADHARVLEGLCVGRREPLEQRKRAWRQLCLQWHPDKCGDKASATAMFQYLQGLKDWFLAET